MYTQIIAQTLAAIWFQSQNFIPNVERFYIQLKPVDNGPSPYTWIDIYMCYSVETHAAYQSCTTCKSDRAV